MRTIHRVSSAFVLTTWALCTAVVSNAETIPIVRNGQPTACIVLDNDAEGMNTEAANDFVAIINRISGATLAVNMQPGMVPIYVGEPEHFPHLKIETQLPSSEAFEIHATPEAIYVLGGSSLGTSHGIFTLLRELGCRWIMPGEIGECLPYSKDVAIPSGIRRGQPDFTFRDIWYAYGCSSEGSVRLAEWRRRNRMHRPAVQHGHNLTNTLAEFASFKDRPDLYALIDGDRKTTQICTSNPESVAFVVQAIKKYMKQNPGTVAYSLCPDDNHEFCQCDNCKALDSGRIDSGGLPSIADRYQLFLNQVLDGLRDEYPDLLVTTYAYNRNHTDPPVNQEVNPNTCIFATTSVYCAAHGIGDDGCPSRQGFRDLLERWTSFTNHVYIYEYDPVPYSGGLPWPMWESHAREMAVYKSIGVTGVSFEGQDSWAAYFPNYYIAAQCMWDSSLDGKDLFEDMLQAFFGEAASDMATYYRTLGSVFNGIDRKVEWGLADYPKYFKPEHVDLCREAIENALQRSVSNSIMQRLKMVQLSFEEMDAYLNIRRADASMSYEQYQAQVNRLNDTIDRMAATNEDFLLATIAKEKTMVGIADRFAREQGFVNEWMLCGPFDNLGMDGHDRVYPPEESIDITATYKGKGESQVAWKHNSTPEWTAYVDLLNEFADTEWVCAYALCWVTVSDGPKEVEFRLGSNDSIKAFLNGKEVWNNKIERTVSVDDDIVPVTLPEGTSTILLKIGQSGMNWGFNFRITDVGSASVPQGITVSATPPK
ncbi:MAG: hypothetical protein AMXMBFR84_32170 [Candidatus Hydrogenedentota bacterium]